MFVTLNQICTEVLSCKAVHKCSAEIMSKKESRWRGVVDLREANQLLKYIPEAEPNLKTHVQT